jgi:predicted ATPase/class 3 adenylate cyclase
MAEDEGISPERLKTLLGGIDPEILQQVMPLTGGVITMMFTDIVESTSTKAALGDERYFREVLEPHNKLVRRAVAQHNGRELKAIGDAFLVGFTLPAEAVSSAIAIQEGLRANPIQAGKDSLKVRIGLHTGTPKVYRDEGSQRIDLSGTDVDKAARVESLARGGQVLISEETEVLSRPEVHDWGRWELKGLGRRRIFEVLWPGKTPERPAGRSWLEPIRFLTSFVGREAEVSQAMDAVMNHRLVTLRGMGGIGKTRLADEVGARVAQSFEDGVFFVELAQCPNSESAVATEIATKASVSVRGFADEAQALVETLANRRALFVLDNFEGVATAARLVARLLRQCPGLHFLLTSQLLIGVDGEQQIEVSPMSVPQGAASTPAQLAQFDSVGLFLERARLRRLGWQPSPAELRGIVEVLALTDGIPLSVELAAAWVDRVPIDVLCNGLRKRRSEYLQRTGSGVEEQRHAGIEACIDYSFNLLSADERTLFARLSIFRGNFGDRDVPGVCEMSDVPRLLDSLRGRSFLSMESSLGETRYRMLATLQEYAARRLESATGEFRKRHAAHFLKAVDEADDQIRGKEQLRGIARISADLENIRAGMDTCVEVADHSAVLRYAGAFATYLRSTGRFSEALARAEQGLTSAEALRDPRVVAGAQNDLGTAYADLPTGDREKNLGKAIACYEAALRVYTESDVPLDWAGTQNNLGNAYANLPTGDREKNRAKAITCYEAAACGYESVGLDDEAQRIRDRARPLQQH